VAVNALTPKLVLPLAAVAAVFGLKTALDARRARERPEPSELRLTASLSAGSRVDRAGPSRLPSILPATGNAGVPPENVAPDQIPAALDAADRLPNAFERAARICALMQRWATQDPAAAFQRLQAMPEDDTKWQCVVAVSRIIAGAIPQRVAELLPAIPDGATRSEWVQALAQSWPATDVRAALQWANDLPAGDEKLNALGQIESSWIAQNPGEVATYVGQLPDGATRSEWIGNLAAQWSRTDLNAAIAWANRLDDPGRANAMASIAKTRAMEAPDEAANFVAQLPPGEVQNDAAKVVAGTWALRDPDGAARWALQFSDPDLRDETLRQIVGSWASSADLEGLFDWTRRLPAGPARDTVVAKVVEQTAGILPDSVPGLIGLISDQVKQTQLAEAARGWSRGNPVGAAPW